MESTFFDRQDTYKCQRCIRDGESVLGSSFNYVRFPREDARCAGVLEGCTSLIMWYLRITGLQGHKVEESTRVDPRSLSRETKLVIRCIRIVSRRIVTEVERRCVSVTRSKHHYLLPDHDTRPIPVFSSDVGQGKYYDEMKNESETRGQHFTF